MSNIGEHVRTIPEVLPLTRAPLFPLPFKAPEREPERQPELVPAFVPVKVPDRERAA